MNLYSNELDMEDVQDIGQIDFLWEKLRDKRIILSGAARLFLSDVFFSHLMTIIVSVFLREYRDKTAKFSEVSPHHRTTITYYPRKWVNPFALRRRG